MTMGTMVFGAEMRRSEKWRVYRIRTANSAYELEVQTEGAGPRRCAVMTCLEPASRNGETFEDSAPLLDGQSLYGLSPMEWIGKRLSVGTACTSELQSVDFVSSNPSRVVRSRTIVGTAVVVTKTPAPAPAPAERKPDWAPFPLGQVEMAEAAASVLKSLCHRHDLPNAIKHDPHLMRRFKLALAECGLMIEALSARDS